MDYLFTTILWFIISIVGYFTFWKDWKSLKEIQQWFIIINMGFSISAIINYFFSY